MCLPLPQSECDFLAGVSLWSNDKFSFKSPTPITHLRTVYKGWVYTRGGPAAQESRHSTAVYWAPFMGQTLLSLVLFLILKMYSFCAALGLSGSTQDLCCWVLASLVVTHGLSCPLACGILIPRPRIEPGPLRWKHRVLTTGPSGKFLSASLFKVKDNFPEAPGRFHSRVCWTGMTPSL